MRRGNDETTFRLVYVVPSVWTAENVAYFFCGTMRSIGVILVDGVLVGTSTTLDLVGSRVD